MGGQDVYISSGAFCAGQLEPVLEQATEWGVCRLELSSGLAPHPQAMEAVRAHARRTPGFRYLLHNYFPAPARPMVLNLASGDAESLAASLAHCRQAIDLCSEDGCPFYSVHGGFAARLRPEHLGKPFPPDIAMSRQEATTIFEDSVASLVDYGHRRGVRLLVENNVVAPFNLREGRNELLLMVEADEMASLARRLDSPWFGYLVDVAHARVSAGSLGFDPVEFLRRLAPWTAALHLSENDGRQDSNEPFGDDAWFLPHLSLFPDAVRVIESYRLDRPQLERCLAALQCSLPQQVSP